MYTYQKKVEVFICFSGLIFVSFLNISMDILESGLWLGVVRNEDQFYLRKKESKSSTKNHDVVILSGLDVLNFVIIVNVFGDCFGCLWWKKKCFHIIWFLFYFLMSLIQHILFYFFIIYIFIWMTKFVIFRDFYGFCMLDYLFTILIEHLFGC